MKIVNNDNVDQIRQDAVFEAIANIQPGREVAKIAFDQIKGVDLARLYLGGCARWYRGKMLEPTRESRNFLDKYADYPVDYETINDDEYITSVDIALSGIALAADFIRPVDKEKPTAEQDISVLQPWIEAHNILLASPQE